MKTIVPLLGIVLLFGACRRAEHPPMSVPKFNNGDSVHVKNTNFDGTVIDNCKKFAVLSDDCLAEVRLSNDLSVKTFKELELEKR